MRPPLWHLLTGEYPALPWHWCQCQTLKGFGTYGTDTGANGARRVFGTYGTYGTGGLSSLNNQAAIHRRFAYLPVRF